MKCHVCPEPADGPCTTCGRPFCPRHWGGPSLPLCAECYESARQRMILWAILPALAGVALLMSSLPEFSLLPFAAAAFLFYAGWHPFRPASERPHHSSPDDTHSSDNNPDEPAPCLKCGTTIPAGTTRCPSCGWSYAN